MKTPFNSKHRWLGLWDEFGTARELLLVSALILFFSSPLLCFGARTLGDSGFQKVVFNGIPSSPRESLNARFTVNVMVHNFYHETIAECSGAVIASRMILSAGHCVPRSPGEYVSISFPSAPGEPARSVEDYRFIYHEIEGDSSFFAKNPRYRGSDFVPDMIGQTVASETTFRDLAVFKVSDVPDWYSPIPVVLNDDLTVSDQLFTAGFGRINEEPIAGERQLHWGRHRYVERYRDQDNVTIGYEIAGVGNQGTCVGDSGGPLFRIRRGKAQLIGTVSHLIGPKDTLCDNRGFVTRTANFVKWISESMQEMMEAEESF